MFCSRPLSAQLHRVLDRREGDRTGGNHQGRDGQGRSHVCCQDFEEWLRDNRPRRREVLLRIQQEEQELVVQQGRRHSRAVQLQ